MNPSIAVLWSRLDTPGHDTCRFMPGQNGWALRGSAIFLAGEDICQIRYEVLVDMRFHTREAAVEGLVGDNEIDLRISVAENDNWTVNGVDQPQIAGCIDIDLGFTPATNFLPVRRLGLRAGEEAQAPAAYLAFPELRFAVLPQRYKCLSGTEYEYEAPTMGYKGKLTFAEPGVIAHYPGLFSDVRHFT